MAMTMTADGVHHEYHNFDPVVARPVLGDSGVVTLRYVHGIGVDRPASFDNMVTQEMFVRIRDVPRLLGEENTMLLDISRQSGASISINVDMRSLLNYHVHVSLWGSRPNVHSAYHLIHNLLSEEYDDPYEPLSHSYLRHKVLTFAIDKAAFLLKENNLVKIEADTLTWIEVDASKAWKEGETRDVDVHVYGSKENVNDAIPSRPLFLGYPLKL